MRTIVSLAVVALVAGVALGDAAPEDMMAEMKKCAVCKHLVAHPELMKDMTWETHKIENGMICLTTVPKEKQDEFKAVNAEMMEAIHQVKTDADQGKPVELCRFCASMGDLMKANAKQQHIETQTGAIHMVTSDDPATVAKIHAVADKAIEEQKQMAQQQHTASR